MQFGDARHRRPSILSLKRWRIVFESTCCHSVDNAQIITVMALGHATNADTVFPSETISRPTTY